MDLRQTKNYGDFLRKIHWKVVRDKQSGAWVFLRKIPLTPFWVLKIQRPEKLPSNEFLTGLRKKYRIIQTNIEPLKDSQALYLSIEGYKRARIPFLPSATIVVDVRMSQKHMIALMKSKTRYNLKTAQRKKVNVIILSGINLIEDMKSFEVLFDMQKQNAKRLGIYTLPKTWFYEQVKALGINCFAVMAYYDQKLVAATFYMTSNDTAYYSHNGSLPEGRKVFAPTLCAWEGMLEAKRRGLLRLDFEGMYDARSKVVKWQGFTRFKRGFGGQEWLLPGLYTKWHWPF